MKKLTFEEVKKLVEDNWGFVRNQKAKKSGDMWSNSCLANSVDWQEKLGLEETEQGLKKLKDIIADPTLSPGAKKAKTQSMKYELDPTDFNDTMTHRDVTASIVRGDMNTLTDKMAELEKGEQQKNKTFSTQKATRTTPTLGHNITRPPTFMRK